MQRKEKAIYCSLVVKKAEEIERKYATAAAPPKKIIERDDRPMHISAHVIRQIYYCPVRAIGIIWVML